MQIIALLAIIRTFESHTRTYALYALIWSLKRLFISVQDSWTIDYDFELLPNTATTALRDQR